jgi:hypothetical protein
MSATSESPDEATEPSSPDSAQSIPRAAPARLKKQLEEVLQNFATHEGYVQKVEAKNFLQSLQYVTDAEILRMLLFYETRDNKYRFINKFAEEAGKVAGFEASTYQNYQSKLKLLLKNLYGLDYDDMKKAEAKITEVNFFENFKEDLEKALVEKVGHGTKPSKNNIDKLLKILKKEAKDPKVPDNAPEKTAHEETKAQDAPDDEEEEEVSEEEEEKKEGEGATLCGNQPVSEVT